MLASRQYLAFAFQALVIGWEDHIPKMRWLLNVATVVVICVGRSSGIQVSGEYLMLWPANNRMDRHNEERRGEALESRAEGVSLLSMICYQQCR